MNRRLGAKINLRTFFLILLLFGMEFDVRIVGFFTLRKLVFAVLFSFYAMKKFQNRDIKVLRREAIASLFIFSIFLYALVIVNIIGDVRNYEGAYQVTNLIILFLNMIFFPMILTESYKSVSEFVKYQWYVTLFQSSIILIGRLLLPFRLFIIDFLMTMEDYLRE